MGAIESINKIKGLRFPDQKEPRMVKKLFLEIEGHEKKLKRYLSKNNIETSETESSRRRRGIKQKGRTYNPNPVLEREAVKRSLLPQKIKK